MSDDQRRRKKTREHVFHVKILQRLTGMYILPAFLLLSILPHAAFSLPSSVQPGFGAEDIQGNVRHIRVYKGGELYEEVWYNPEGQLSQRSSYRTGAVPISTYYKYNDSGLLEEWYQEGINRQRIWSYHLEYDHESRPLRLLSIGSDDGLEYLEEYRYLEDSVQETVLYNAAGEPVWRRRDQDSGGIASWELYQSDGNLFSRGVQSFQDNRLVREQLFDEQGSILEETVLLYDEQGRLTGTDLYDAQRLVQQLRRVYLSDNVIFSRLYEPHSDTAAVQQTMEYLDEQGNWIRRIETSLFEEAEGIQTISKQKEITRDIRYW